MNAFADAATVLHADPNLSEPATYRKLGQWPGQAIRIIRSQPDETHVTFGRTVRTGTDVVTVLVADVDAAEHDTFELGDGTILTALDAALDAEGVSWTVPCRRGGVTA